jgi:hypothetical protein
VALVALGQLEIITTLILHEQVVQVVAVAQEA